MLEIIVPCARGLEGLVRAELESLGVERCQEQPGAVRGAGSWPEVRRVNRWSRCGRRVLVGLADWPAVDAAMLAGGLRDVVRRDPGIREVLAPERSLSVHASASRSRLRDGRAIAGIVREAIGEAQEVAFGRRAAVEPHGADLPLRVRIHKDLATLLLDTSGWPLDGRRGPEEPGEPRRTVCAALLAASGWDGVGDVVDPFAGDGRVLEEVADALAERPPGRRELWPWQGLAGEGEVATGGAPRGALPDGLTLHAGSVDQREVRTLRSWAQQEGLPVRARHTHLDQLAAPSEAGLVISAPGSLSPKRWGQLGTALKHRFPGWRAALLCPGDAWKTLALKPSRTLRVKDGELDATIVALELWAGRKDW